MAPQRYKTYLVTSCFLLCLAWPFINGSFSFVKDIESFENRKATDKPTFEIKHLDGYPAKFESYYNDHFNLRSQLIRLNNQFKIIAFKQSPLPDKIIIGSDGWLFSASEEFDSFLGVNRLTPSELEELTAELEYRKKYLEQKNCRFYFMVVPGKASIYEEKIGFRYYRTNKQSWGEQLIEYLNKNSDLVVIDVYEHLRNSKEPEDIFHTLDNHWNDLGAFHSANKIIELMKKDFKQLAPLPLSNFYIRKKIIKAGNLQKMLGNLPMFKETEIKLEAKAGLLASDADKAGYVCPEGFAYPWEFEMVKVTETNKPNLLIISDSFGDAIYPFLAENFGKTVKIFDAWEYKLNETIVENEKPDAVLLMINEPIIRNLLKNKAQKLQNK